MATGMVLAGVDLAWNCERNGTGIALGRFDGRVLTVESIRSPVLGYAAVVDVLDRADGLRGVAIDASLIISNARGRRPCETALTRRYAARQAGCHSSNLALYPDSPGVRLATHLAAAGYRHLGAPRSERFQLEVYPHPALIEVFGLDARLRYKKGPVAERRVGQMQLARLLRSLDASPVVQLALAASVSAHFDEARIATLGGRALKHNEDALDAVVCLYASALYALGEPVHRFGDVESGYIVVPARRCV